MQELYVGRGMESAQFSGCMRWSTEQVHPSSRLAGWNEVTSSVFTPLSIDADDQATFKAALTSLCTGRCTIARIQSEGSTVRHSHQHVGADQAQPAYLLHFQVKGSSVNSQAGRSVALRPGDCTLVDSTRPYELQFGADSEFLVGRFLAQRVREFLPNPDDEVSQLISGDNGPTRALQRLIEAIWSEVADESAIDWVVDADRSILPMLAIAWEASGLSAVPKPSNALRRRVMGYVGKNFDDPDLTLASIATELATSPRWIQKAFSGSGNTPVQYIQKVRIENAAQLLMCAGETVTDAAMASGFNDITHFGRVFKKYTGQGPRQFRAEGKTSLCSALTEPV